MAPGTMVSTPAAAKVAQSMPEALTVRVMVATMGLAGQMLIWFELSEEPSIWWATLTSAVWLVFVMRKG